jgi:hypothetical protein
LHHGRFEGSRNPIKAALNAVLIPGGRGKTMETPCPKCGTLKTESVRHGLIYKTLWGMGYHLRRCSFCNRWRLQPRGDNNRPHPNDLTAEKLTEHFNRRIAASRRRDAALAGAGAVAVGAGVVSVASAEPAPRRNIAQSRAAVSSVEAEPAARPIGAQSRAAISVAEVEPTAEYAACPRCGNMKYRRSRRRWYERWLDRPKMARCLKCSHRYPHPD